MFFPSRFQNIPILKNRLQGTSLVVQRLSPHAPTAGNMDTIPGQGSKFPHAIQCGRKKKEKEKKNRLPFLEQYQVHHKTGVAGAEVPHVPAAPHMHSLPQEQHPHQRACLLWLTTQSPELHGGSLLGTYPTLSGQIMTRTHHSAPCSKGSLSSPHPPPPKPWQPRSLYCLHGSVISTMLHGDSHNSTPSHQPLLTASFTVMSF